MTAEEHMYGVGAIVTNLQGLETVIRIFLARINNQHWKIPGTQDKFVDETFLTNFRSLGPLIEAYNEALSEKEKEFSVDRMIVDIRDAIAHGRLLSAGDTFPATLYKFGVAQNGKVPIVFQEALTVEWLDAKKGMIRNEQLKVVNCYKFRGYEGFD